MDTTHDAEQDRPRNETAEDENHERGGLVVLGQGVVEEGAHLGYPSARGYQGPLVLGENAHIRSGLSLIHI